MVFVSEIKQLEGREKVMMQREFDAVVGSDAIYCKIENGERWARHNKLLSLLNCSKQTKTNFLNLWFAEQVTAVVADKKDIAKQNISKIK
jgi:hypothetical protein